MSTCKARQLIKPWITKGLLKSIKIKNRLFYSGDKLRYKVYKNKISSLTRLSKKSYYHNYFETNLHNMKKTWEGINNLIKYNNRKSKRINTLKHPIKGVTQNSAEISNILNNRFATIGHKLASKIPNSDEHFSTLAKLNISESFFFESVSL